MAAPLVTDERLREFFTVNAVDRSSGYVDLVSQNNALLDILKRKKRWKPTYGASIQVPILYDVSDTYVRYTGYEYLNPAPSENLNMAEFEDKQAAVSATLSGREIRKNRGSKAQIIDLVKLKLDVAEIELKNRFTEDLHGDGTADGGRQIGGLQKAIPTVPDQGVYGGIDRASHESWRTNAFDATTDFTGVTGINKDTIREIWARIVTSLYMGSEGVDLILATTEHYLAYEASMVAMQRIVTDGTQGNRKVGAGFTSLRYFGAGRDIDVVLEGGRGSYMPDVTYFLDTDGLGFRYYPGADFQSLGPAQRPINQDAMVQHVGFMGEFVMSDPRFQAVLFES